MADQMIYLDYAASTPVDPRVLDRMREVAETNCANPSSTHAAGREAQAIIAHAAAQLGGLLNVDPAPWSGPPVPPNRTTWRLPAARATGRIAANISLR